ncbi:CBS domain-containing protein [Streptomyces sp. S.PB5]|uniref:CBS domain-containing protein n=1 Tax=Streptomyces sp. S.PB5 TaxID=3020844 RepID=UPI0025B15DFC|nr:CBS domain-containing protein [Streptomyces sp. S.PB5]MDN3027944.1 CBS domain-containing protein [Streptomyces sp. S.PB5]
MDDRDARVSGAASVEARRAVPSYARKPAEQFRQTMMVRYLQAMASHSARVAAEEPAIPPTAAPARTGTPTATVADLQVRHVMKRSVTGVQADTPFLEIARVLARQRIGAIPVIDEAQRVAGVIAESDLLARAADLSAPPGERHHAFAKLLGRHRGLGGDAGATAATLMSAPALTVHPWTPVVEAARTAARSRVRQVFVTDHRDRLVGVVSRGELLHALIRDDRAIHAEIVSQVIDGLGLDRDHVDVRVRNGTVTLSGSVDAELIPRLNEQVARIPDVYEVVDRLIAH